MSKVLRISALLLLMVCLTTGLEAQFDAHYWTHQYGAKGLLLNGAVIASSDDETNIFYNPGALGLDDNLGFAFSFLSPTYASIMADNFLGDQSRLSDQGVDFSPGFLAVRFQPFKTRKLTFGLASFERFKSNIHFRDRITSPINQTGFFLLRADLDFRRQISEEWFAIGVSYNVTDRLGIGLSQFSTWHSQEIDLLLKKEVLASPAPQDIAASWRNEFNYGLSTYSGFITKLGISYTGDNFKLGMTYTSPTYGIIASSVNYSLDDQRINTSEDLVSVVSNRKGATLASYKSPQSIGFGFEVQDHKFIYSFSGEYFNGIDEYVLFEDIDDALDGLATGDAITNIQVLTGNQSVFNFGLGMQYLHSDRTTWICGFRTDFNENTNLLLNDAAEYLGSTPNVFHISGGTMIKMDKNTFSLGFDFGYGKSRGGTQLANFDDVDINNLFTISGKDNVSIEFYSLTVFLTYDFIFQNISKPEKDEDR